MSKMSSRVPARVARMFAVRPLRMAACWPCSRGRYRLQGGIAGGACRAARRATDFPRGNLDDLLGAITGKLWPLGDDVRFVPGHGPMSTFGEERRANPYVSDSAIANRSQ